MKAASEAGTLIYYFLGFLLLSALESVGGPLAFGFSWLLPTRLNLDGGQKMSIFETGSIVKKQ